MSQKSSSAINPMKTIKFLYSYGGRIVPRPTDGKLRYVAGHTRVLSVDRSISFSELMVKFGDLCGSSLNLKCKLPSEDLDLLVSVKSDEDLQNVIEEYESVSPEAKIRAVLFPSSAKKDSLPSSPISCFDFPSSKRIIPPPTASCYASPPCAVAHRRSSPAVGHPVLSGKCRGHDPRHFKHVPYNNRFH